ncbi:MAG: hypothetical protein IJ737_01095 [Ruminococcus sp.]|nr:hypothetical protein [Ruminococcus sp.]
MTVKRIAALMISAVLAAGMAGCGNSGSGDKTGNKNKKQSEPDLSAVKFIDAEYGGGFRGEFWAALADNGDLYMWGHNEYGQLGTGDTGEFHSAVKVMEDVTKMELGADCTAAIDKNGTLYMWGGNSYGQLGIGSTEASTKPQKVMDNVSDVVIMDETVWALVGDNEVYVWGNNEDNIFKADTDVLTSPEKLTDGAAEIAYPYVISTEGSLLGFKEGEPNEVTAGIKKAFRDDDTLYTITNDDVLVHWKSLGTYARSENLLENARDFRADGLKGNEFYGALSNDGVLYMWGRNFDHRCGASSDDPILHPAEVMTNVKQFELGLDSSYAVDNDGILYSWGQNNVGQLCNGTTQGFDEPTPVMSDVSKIRVWSHCIAVITNDGKLYIGGSAGRIDNDDTDHGQFETPICVNDKSKRADIITKGNSDPADNGLDYNGLPGEAGFGVE